LSNGGYRFPRKVLDAPKVTDAERSAAGLAPSAFTPKLGPGAVFKIEDDDVVFPTARIAGSTRTSHSERWVIVVDRIEDSRNDKTKTISIVPCSASCRGAAASFEYDIPDPTSCGFSKEPIRALVHLLQPILKSELKGFQGQLSATALTGLQAVIALKFGLSQERDRSICLPPVAPSPAPNG
jgi:hypothetical protein